MWQALLYWLSVTGIFLVGMMVIVRNKKESHIAYFLFSCSLALFLISQYFIEKSNPSFWLGVSFLSLSVAAPSFYAFLYGFVHKRSLHRRIYIILALPLVLFAPISFSDLLINVQITSSGTNFEFGPLYGLHSFVIVAFLFAALVMLIRAYGNTKNKERKQYELFFVAFVPFLLTGFLTGVTYANNESVQFLRPLGALVMTATIGYAMAYHKLFDIRFFVVRATVYLLTVLTIGAVYGIVAFGIIAQLFFETAQFDFVQQITSAFLAVLLAFSFQSILQFFNRLTNHLFYRDAYDLQTSLGEFNQAIVSTIDLEKMLLRTSDVIEKNLKPEYCAFAIRQDQSLRLINGGNRSTLIKSVKLIDQKIAKISTRVLAADMEETIHGEVVTIMHEDGIGIIIRITSDIKSEGAGYILLGYKKSGNAYNAQDLRFVDIIGSVLAIALQNALQFEEIQRFNVTLQEKVNDATRRLRHSNDRLKAMDETKDDFISMASHQLRTPLTSIKGYVSMVLEGDAGKVNDMQRNMLEQAFISTQRMTFLIADLLNLSRLKTGKFVIEPIETNVADLVEQEVSQLQDTAKARNLTLTYAKPKEFPTVMLDETKTRQVVMNYIDNAIYYTPSGGSINVAVRETDSSIEYTVTDNGIGVPKALQHHLFTKFYRAENAKRARPDGTGLGLFMAKKVIIAQGGAVIFKSEEGKGSTFGFTFPKTGATATKTQ